MRKTRAILTTMAIGASLLVVSQGTASAVQCTFNPARYDCQYVYRNPGCRVGSPC